MDDLVSRRAAIDAICDNCDTVEASCPHYPCGRYMAVEKLPSAQPERCEDCENFSKTRLLIPQPEIIHCRDCKHYKAYEYTGRLACHYVIGGTVVRNLNDFCSRAERRTDDQSKR